MTNLSISFDFHFTRAYSFAAKLKKTMKSIVNNMIMHFKKFGLCNVWRNPTNDCKIHEGQEGKKEIKVKFES